MNRVFWAVWGAVLAVATAAWAAAPPSSVPAVRAELKSLGVEKVVFIRRNTCTSDHYYTDHINDRAKPGGGLCVLDLASGAVTDLVPEFKHGWLGRFDVSFDARRIVFGWKKAWKEGFRIYEIDVDPASGRRGPGDIRQLTFPPANEAELVRKYGKARGGLYYHHGTDDMHPAYLPDGRIVLVSTRCQFGVLCNNDDVFTTMTLYRMDADGKNMVKLTNSALSESSPAVLPDGRILYTRWEYIEKGHIGAKCLWAMRPDGSGSAHFLVPADRNIYFQVLDENYLAVQTERSYVNYRPGETRSCIGCHETPNSAADAAPRRTPRALKRPPSVPAAQVGDASARRTLHYPADVQPVLDKHCMECHGKNKNVKLDLRGTPTAQFSVSYEGLLAKLQPGLAAISENSKPAVGYLPARSCFSHNTHIVAMLSGGRITLANKELAARAGKLAVEHKDVKLSPGELLKISNWIDANCQFYGSYRGRRHVKHKGRPDYRPTPTFASAISALPPTTNQSR